jgi:hypothetical protein
MVRGSTETRSSFPRSLTQIFPAAPRIPHGWDPVVTRPVTHAGSPVSGSAAVTDVEGGLVSGEPAVPLPDPQAETLMRRRSTSPPDLRTEAY